jgi:1-acyl-sn-glycerol-3-phosphate acyltransferase
MNALFMVMSALLVIVFFAMGASIVGVFLIIALMNALVAAYIFRLVPEFLMRFLIWVLITVMYRVRPTGLEKLPETGAAILAPNHVSFVDALILGGTVRRPVRFVMYHRIYNLPVLNFVFRTARAIPIAGRREDSELYERAFEQMRGALDDGELLCLFPEGQLTRDGEVGDFRPGILQLLKTHPVPVYPIALQGLWESLFSRQDGRTLFRWPKRMFARIGVVFGDALSPAGLEVSRLRDEVAKLRGAER